MVGEVFSGGVITVEHVLMLAFGAVGAWFIDRAVRRLERILKEHQAHIDERLDALEAKNKKREEHD